MEAILLECQVAVQDFTSALKMLITEKFELVIIYLQYMESFINMQVPCSIYPVIIDSFEEYRYVCDQIYQKGFIYTQFQVSLLTTINWMQQ